MALIGPLAWELPYAATAAIKRKKKFKVRKYMLRTSHQSEWPSLINPQITSAGGAVEKGNPPALLVGM